MWLSFIIFNELLNVVRFKYFYSLSTHVVSSVVVYKSTSLDWNYESYSFPSDDFLGFPAAFFVYRFTHLQYSRNDQYHLSPRYIVFF